MSAAVDWEVAARRAARLAPPGPRGSRAELQAVTGMLRGSAAEAPSHVAEVTGLHSAARAAAAAPVYVVDRPRWAQANVEMFAHLTGDLLPEVPGPAAARVAGEEMGVVLALLAPRVLGQFDPFTPTAPRPGRLVLVAPNVLRVERDLDLDAMDFRLWVCLHEQTHAVQFAAAPWLAEHLAGRMRALVGGVSGADDGGDRVVRAVRAVAQTVGSVLGGPAAPGQELGGALVEAFLSEAERAAMAEVVAVMSLLEGHADVVMDAVGPAYLPSVRRIRASFEKRRDGTSLPDILLRRLLGMDAKVAQYRNGARFVRDVVGLLGHAGLNAVWTAPEHLPTPEEIAEPASWVRRVHG
ncbi:zinc-dependent metalloprotease [Georgenia sp. TF02-10]|uniref:zinc-dependent metalloprotease n=1 Tax=Georgenia sp. TF02-10 TaxID=2917725 RepID=UPI001FA781E3|nr:zinc-dependent metalloprotease [Georgenia sp. TF02-10]UNX54488.1 zinc-dependent metalloprotease [Georgenia sp. TF02-10]